MTGLTALAVLLTLPALAPLYDDGGWLLRVIGAVGVVAVAGLLVQALRLPPVARPLVGAAGLSLYVSAIFAGSTLVLVLPTPQTGRALWDLLAQGADEVNVLVAPVPTSPGLVLLGVLSVGAMTILVDSLTIVVRRPVLTAFPLAVLLLGPAAAAGTTTTPVAFFLGAAAWLLLLASGTSERDRSWGARLSGPSSRRWRASGAGATALFIGVLSIAATSAATTLVPGADGDSRDSAGSSSISTYNPLTTLRGDLTLPRPRTILTYTTNVPDPDYLRLTTLDTYDGEGWRQDALRGRLSEDGVADRTLPTRVGVDSTTPSVSVTSRIDIESLRANWLPAPATPSTVGVAGPWLWDARSESIFATRTDTSQVQPYEVQANRVRADARALDAAGDVLPAEIVPFAVAPRATAKVKQITTDVLAGRRSDYAKALALQSYFQSGRFTYSLRTEESGAPDALENFLRTRQGYCQQYASAMAAMLRLAGVPSRVAVGFTPGTKQPDGSWRVTTENAHAWPEVWFSGFGWLRFEPTPGIGTAPSYGRSSRATPQTPVEAAPAAPAPRPETSAAPVPPAGPLPEQLQEGIGATGPAGDDSRGVPRWLSLTALAVAGLALPRLLHCARARSRWRGNGPKAAWDQLREDARDAGIPLPGSLSPRQVHHRIAELARLEQPHVLRALGRVCVTVEQDLYAPASGAGALTREGEANGSLARAALREDVLLIGVTLRQRLSWRERARLYALPPSTLGWVAGWSTLRIRRGRPLHA